MDKSQPSRSTFKVSAIISTYNSEKFMRGCLQDLTEQTLYKKGELEIIVIDSASEQNEQAIVQEFQARYQNIFYIRTLERETLYTAWNCGIQAACGKYITNANTDDRHRPDALEVMANYLDGHPKAAFVYADQLITSVANDTWTTTEADKRWNWPSFSYTELERRCIIGSQPMWRNSLHEKYGYFRSEFSCAGDYEFWLRIGKTENIIRLPQILGLYYDNLQGLEHASQISGQETYRIWDEYGILQRGVIPTSSVPVTISRYELNALPYRADTQPLISIIIPSYNHASFLGEAVESIINQTYENWECIIVNDGSPDDTSDVARALINLYKNKSIHLLEQQNDGVINARNVGFSKSLGEYILFVDADDKIHPNFLSETLSVLIEHSSVGFVYTDIQLFGVKHDLISNGDFVPERFLNSNQASVTSLFRREIYEQVDGFKKVMELGWEDWEFWISAYEKGWQGYRLGKAYLYYRQHASGSRLQNLHSSHSNQALQKAKIIKLHSKLYNQREVHWAENILRQHNSPLAIGLTDLHLCQQRKPEIRRIKYPAINYISEGVHRPLWSVMIPIYNGTKYLEQTLRSVLEQDPGSDLMQIEVVDDCSTQDDPEELVRKIGQGKISFYRQPKNLGLIGSWNDCIKRARGHWVHILHQDDVVKFGFYKRLQAAVEKEPNIGAAFCRYFYMDEKGFEQYLSPLERETPGVISNWIERIAVMQRIECPSIVVKREVYEDLGGFSQEAYYAADWEMWKRIAAHYSVWYEPELLACYRSHSSSESSRLIRSGANIADIRKAIEISESYLPTTIAAELSNQARENCAFKALNIARRMLSAGDIDAAIAQMREGIKSSQSSNVISLVLELIQELNKNSNQHNLFPINALDQLLSAFQEPFSKQQEIALVEGLKLKEINLIIFPDWEQSEESLYQDLANVISSLVNHPNKNQVTLLIHTGNLSEDEASLVLSDSVMNLLMQEDLDVTDEPEIFLIGQLSVSEWEALLPRIQARIILLKENQEAISQANAYSCKSVQVGNIPVFEINPVVN
ncbi:MAG: glycosyltransferase [Gloeocapsa sp. UFS-A4-WI-NPMV-4B04]|jgi:glycosyltransferase involved in cell wall biosynthesis|nr:glycosyltransferase [Gloeocapsa sp. UFS-A4-WI-NPMV-4B04]